MKKNKAYARYRWQEKHKKQYTFTKTKFVVGFLVSVLTSVFLGSYFDRYGAIVLTQTISAIEIALDEGSENGPKAETSAESEGIENKPPASIGSPTISEGPTS